MKMKHEKALILKGLAVISMLTFTVVACQKAGESGARKKPGTNRNDVVTQGKVLNEELFEKNQEIFKTCLKSETKDLFTVEGFSDHTLTGKNLEIVLSQMTSQKDLKSALIEVDKSRKDLHEKIKLRLDLINELMILKKDLAANKKFLFMEGLSEALFPFSEKVLSQPEAAVEAKKLDESKSSLADSDALAHELAEIVRALKDEKAGTNALQESQKRLDDKIKELTTAQSKKLEGKIAKVKSVASRIDQKDKKLQQEYEALSNELVEISGVLEKKACSQMIIEKTEKKGDLLNSYLQALKTRLDLESMNGSKSSKGK